MKQLRSTAPSHSILNPHFPYTRSEDTNLHLTFARARAGLTLGVLPLDVLPQAVPPSLGVPHE